MFGKSGTIVLWLGALSLAGCGTISTKPAPFGGVRSSVENYTFAIDPVEGMFWLGDIPLSAAADAVMLPVTIPIALSRPEQAPAPAPAPRPEIDQSKSHPREQPLPALDETPSETPRTTSFIPRTVERRSRAANPDDNTKEN